MYTWPIGLSTGCFYQKSIFDCLETIRESGFSIIEICFSPAHLDYHNHGEVRRASKRIEQLGMEAYSFHAPFTKDFDISSLCANQRQSALDDIFQAVEAAALLRVRYFVIHPGPESSLSPPPEERLQRMEHTVNTLNRIADLCRSLGLTCVLENKLPHLLFGNTSDILWILDALNTIDVGVCLDTGHAFLSGDFPNLMHKLAGHIKMLHVHDNGGQRDDHLPPGDGCIDWNMVLHTLESCLFRGALILELAGTPDPSNTMSNARRGRSFLRQTAYKLATTKLNP